eukprot:3282519-Alexandrium_andersonii.AAC.1
MCIRDSRRHPAPHASPTDARGGRGRAAECRGERGCTGRKRSVAARASRPGTRSDRRAGNFLLR